jgi:hypothetical protein
VTEFDMWPCLICEKVPVFPRANETLVQGTIVYACAVKPFKGNGAGRQSRSAMRALNFYVALTLLAAADLWPGKRGGGDRARIS